MIAGRGGGSREIFLPLKLLRSSFSALARFEFGREPASALRLRDSMRWWCLVGGFDSSLFGFAGLALTKPAPVQPDPDIEY